MVFHGVIITVSSTDYIDIADMANYDYSAQAQRNINKKISEQYGMVAVDPHRDLKSLSNEMDTCDPGCIRSMEYLQRIVKSLLRQMGVHSHVFGPGEAITIDLRAELKYDDYITLTKFSTSKQHSDKYLYRIDEIMSNFIHVVEHSSSSFEFLENIIHFPPFYTLKFWMILGMCTVIGSMIIMLFVKAYNSRDVRLQILYGFLIIFILSCVWSFSHMYEDKKAEVHATLVQSNGLPPDDCDYHKMNYWDSFKYFFRVNVFGYKDRCSEHYSTIMTDPFWKVNPMEAISSCMAFFIFKPMDYIGQKLGSFYVNFIGSAPVILKPILLVFAFFITILMIYGPFRISTPLLTIEPWRPPVPALERNPVLPEMHAIGHERIRNEIMERPDGPMVKSVRDAATDMDGFQEYLTDEGSDEIEIPGPFARFRNGVKKENKKPTTRESPSSTDDLKWFIAKNASIRNDNTGTGTSSGGLPKMKFEDTKEPRSDIQAKTESSSDQGIGSRRTRDILREIRPGEVVECASVSAPCIKIVKEELLRDALRENVTGKSCATSTNDDIEP